MGQRIRWHAKENDYDTTRHAAHFFETENTCDVIDQNTRTVGEHPRPVGQDAGSIGEDPGPVLLDNCSVFKHAAPVRLRTMCFPIPNHHTRSESISITGFRDVLFTCFPPCFHVFFRTSFHTHCNLVPRNGCQGPAQSGVTPQQTKHQPIAMRHKRYIGRL
jgi:hypothetical protein